MPQFGWNGDARAASLVLNVDFQGHGQADRNITSLKSMEALPLKVEAPKVLRILQCRSGVRQRPRQSPFVPSAVGLNATRGLALDLCKPENLGTVQRP